MLSAQNELNFLVRDGALLPICVVDDEPMCKTMGASAFFAFVFNNVLFLGDKNKDPTRSTYCGFRGEDKMGMVTQVFLYAHFFPYK